MLNYENFLVHALLTWGQHVGIYIPVSLEVVIRGYGEKIKR